MIRPEQRCRVLDGACRDAAARGCVCRLHERRLVLVALWDNAQCRLLGRLLSVVLGGRSASGSERSLLWLVFRALLAADGTLALFLRRDI